MRKNYVISLILITLLLVACGGQDNINLPDVVNDSLPGSSGEGETLGVEAMPRVEVTPTPPLPPTFTPAAMAHQGHLYLLPVSGADGSIQYAYKVRAGDTLSAISSMYGVSVKDVMLINNVSDANHIEEGDLLIIPVVGY